MTDDTEDLLNLSPSAQSFLIRVVKIATNREPFWMKYDEDPGPMLECRRAGLVTSDIYAVMPTKKGCALAAILESS